MKSERKFLYALTKREANAAQDACNRITADLSKNLGITNRQFNACDRAAYALARPAVDAGGIVLTFTPFEFKQLLFLFLEWFGRWRFRRSILRNRCRKVCLRSR